MRKPIALCNKNIFALFLLAIISIAANAQSKIGKDFLLGRFDYTKDTSFIKVNGRYADNVTYLQKTTYAAYKKMYAAALKDGIKLNIISGTRSFDNQSSIWKAKWNDPQFAAIENTAARVTELLRWSSMPGTSRHHWGTDMDLVTLQPEYFNTHAGKKMYAWMQKNAATYGFYQPFTADRETGYKEEKWHWSYLPLSKLYLNEYVKQITYTDINGFDGYIAAEEIKAIDNWVLGVNLACK